MTANSYDDNDPNYVKVLDHGFVYLVDSMGEDSSIVQAARVSYGAGTKTVREDRGLIRYLFRHRHSSPIEMCELKFHVKLPIFVARQWIRHRTASVNEVSARYSILEKEFYIPDDDAIQQQSKDNKQGRAGEVSETSKRGVRWIFQAVYDLAYDSYQMLLGERDETKFSDAEIPFDPYGEDDPLFDEEFPGIARELSRCTLPVGAYTSMFWKLDLWNLQRFLLLRLDSHAQYEIRLYAEAIYKLIQPIYPAAMEAFDDYMRYSVNLSRMENELLRDLLQNASAKDVLKKMIAEKDDIAKFAAERGLSLRELNEFMTSFYLI